MPLLYLYTIKNVQVTNWRKGSSRIQRRPVTRPERRSLPPETWATRRLPSEGRMASTSLYNTDNICKCLFSHCLIFRIILLTGIHTYGDGGIFDVPEPQNSNDDSQTSYFETVSKFLPAPQRPGLIRSHETTKLS